VGQIGDFSLLFELSPGRGDGTLKEFLVLFGDLHEADSHTERVFLFINAVHVGPHDLTGETNGLAIRWDDSHSEIFVHAEGFIASQIDPAQGDVSDLALDGTVF